MNPPTLVCLPVSDVDVHLAEAMLKWAAEIGGCPNHPCLLVTSESVTEEHLRPLAEKVFPRVYHHRAQLGAIDKGWPDGANQMFAQTALFCEKHCQRSFFFCEPDQTPTMAGWMDRLDASYQVAWANGKPCFGFINPSWIVDTAGFRHQYGTHMVGTGFYPKDLRAITTKHLLCYGRAFDVVIAPDVVPRARHTNLIKHNWLTHRYQFNGERVFCEAREGRLPGQKGFSLPGSFDPVDHAVIHGCKDGTVIEALRDWNRATGRLPAVVDVPQKRTRKRRVA